MKLTVINSNSAGNCYVLDNGKEALIIECGVSFEKIKKALAFDLKKVVGCIITHEHKDHCCSVQKVVGAGIDVYATAGTIEAMKIINHRLHPIEKNKAFQVGEFKILAFKVMHDCAEPVGYLINHAETGNVLFLTDTYYVPNTFKGLNNILVEANYSKEILDERLRSGASPDFLRNRVLQSHMSLETTKQLLRANNLEDVHHILLIHLSDSNSNAEQFKREITELTGKSVHIAEAGLVIENFNSSPF